MAKVDRLLSRVLLLTTWTGAAGRLPPPRSYTHSFQGRLPNSGPPRLTTALPSEKPRLLWSKPSHSSFSPHQSQAAAQGDPGGVSEFHLFLPSTRALGASSQDTQIRRQYLLRESKQYLSSTGHQILCGGIISVLCQGILLGLLFPSAASPLPLRSPGPSLHCPSCRAGLLL